jgi:ribonucleoside-diphosphate reductase alpha chain
LPGQVYTIETGNGKLYVTITSHNNRPIEIFMSMGKSGQLFNVFGEALGRVISIALQHGVPLDSVIKTMKGIYSERATWTRFEETDNKPVQILSIPDALAKLLERYYLNDGKEEKDAHLDDRLFCTKCGTYSVILVEGCKTCLNCSESACA